MALYTIDSTRGGGEVGKKKKKKTLAETMRM